MANLVLLALAALLPFFALLLLYGASRWRVDGAALRTQLRAVHSAPTPQHYDPQELDALPAPVQRYFRAALTPGQPLVAGAALAHSGSFNMSETAERWKPFTSQQQVVTRRPGFVWEARIAMAPGVPVRVYDAYVAGTGVLHATLFGVMPLVNMAGTAELARGELMRFLAEAAWFPTALLPSQGMHWEAVDAQSARATLMDGDTVVSLLFHFDDDGLIQTVHAEARGRTVDGAVVPTPWEGRWWDYTVRDGMRVPMQGEVAWLLPQGPLPYWRGRIENLAYEFT
jgi:hypothetical protein